MESGAYDIELLATLDDHGRPWLVVVDASGSTAKWLARIRGVTRRRAAYVVAVLARLHDATARRGFDFNTHRDALVRFREWRRLKPSGSFRMIANRVQAALVQNGEVATGGATEGCLAPIVLNANVVPRIAPSAESFYAPLFMGPAPGANQATAATAPDDRDRLHAAGSAPAIDPRMPPVPSLFVGRAADVETLLDRLEKAAQVRAPEQRVQMVAALKGMAGVGKTSLAVHLASRPEIRRWFPGGVLWAHTGSSPQVAADLSHWGALLEDPSVRSEPSTMRLAERVAALADASPVLAIVDDVQSVDDVVMFQTAIGRRSVLLATTRRPLLASQIARRRAEQVHEVRTLGLDDAHVLLEAIAPAVRATSRAIRTRLLRQLGGLPIAIHVAGRLLASEAESGLDVERLAAELASAKPPLRWMLALEAPHEMYVGSLDPLRSTTPKMRTLLERSLACLSEDARRHFALMGGLPDESRVPAAVLADLWETDDPRATIRELVAAGLLDVAGPDQFSLHSLINAFASLLLHDGQHDTTAARRRSRARRDRPTG